MQRKTLALGSLVAVATLLAAGTVLAGRHFGNPERLKEHVFDRLDEALEEQPLSAPQREAIEATLDRAIAQMQATKEQRRAMLERALGLFEADTLDPAAIEQLKQEHVQAMGGGLQSALVEVHDVLTPAQRKAVVAEVREHVAQGGCRHGW